MNETNYRRLRTDLVGLLNTPERFDHWKTYHRDDDGTSPVCVACRCRMLETGKLVIHWNDGFMQDPGGWEPIARWLSLTDDDARALFVPRPALQNDERNYVGEPFLRDAIAHLDEIAQRHGLTVPTELDGPAAGAREAALESASHSSGTSSEREAAFLESLRQDARDTAGVA